MPNQSFRLCQRPYKVCFELHDERSSCFVVGLVVECDLDEHVLSNGGDEKCHLHVQHVHLVAQLHRDYGHYADDLEPPHGSEGASAVNAGDLRKSSDDGSTAVGAVQLNFEHPPGANNPVSRED